MNLLKEVLRNQVYPAMGCTEPTSVALCAAYAAELLGETGIRSTFTLDAKTYKNGMGVTLPNTGGERGNLFAGVLGMLIAKPAMGMQILKAVNEALVLKAKELLSGRNVTLRVDPLQKGFYVRAALEGAENRTVCVISNTHTQVTLLEKNGKRLTDKRDDSGTAAQQEYAVELEKCSIRDLARIADEADAEDLAYIKEGIEMNMKASECGMTLKKVGYYLMDLKKHGYLLDDLFTSTKILTACATDARMDGFPVPVMSSGESGNQGIVAVLVPYNFGRTCGVPDETIYKSIVLSHLMNAYVKLFTGGLSPICGCAIAAGVGAATAIVYQLNGSDIEAISLAINNLVTDLGGMLCDGAKAGCSLKVVSSADSAIRSAYMGIHHYGITEGEGFVGKTAEETIRNLARISKIGMENVDPTIIEIMIGKQKRD